MMAAISLAPFKNDPLGFVETQYPWGHGDLEGKEIREWQRIILEHVGTWLASDHWDQPCRIAVASGHGVGKSALISWLTQWGGCTIVDCRGTITANTESQLRTKTWTEMNKWYHRLAVRDFFMVDGLTFRAKDRKHAKTWHIDALPWSKDNPESFAGLHNEGKRILVLFDEASAIDDEIWKVIEGAFTDENTQILFVVFGNPTRPSGRFFDCFNRLRHRWFCLQVDSRDVPGTNKQQIREWIEDNGEDSDFVRVRVRGMFPRRGSNSLIGYELVTQAQNEDVSPRISDPLILGVDVAREGDDQTVIYPRKGLVAGLHGGPWKFRGYDNVAVAKEVQKLIIELKPQVVNIDGGGPGGGVIDILREWNYNVNEIKFGGSPFNDDYANKRAEIWCDLRDWLKDGGSIPWNDTELQNELTNQTYRYRTNKNNDLILTSKDMMKADGLPSPDSGDALACTFAVPTAPVTDVSRGLGDVSSSETDYKGGWE